MRATIVFMLFSLLVALVSCPSLSPVEPLTGGSVLPQEQAEQLISELGVVHLEFPLFGEGNGLSLQDGFILTVCHALPFESDFAVVVSGRQHVGDLIRPRTIPHSISPKNDACLIRLRNSEASSPRSAAGRRRIKLGAWTPGERILVVGHWGQDTHGSLRAVAIRGRAISTPEVFNDDTTGGHYVDLGPHPEIYEGLSGSAVFVENEQHGGDWVLVGILFGVARTNRGHVANVVAPIPPEWAMQIEKR